MAPMIKLIAAFFVAIVLVVLFCFLWLDSVYFQLGLLGVLLTTVLTILPWQGIVRELRILIPLLVSLFIVYCIFAIFQIGNSSAYWIRFGITRSSLLISSMLFMRIFFHWLTMDDILNLPFSISVIKYLILGQLLYEVAVDSYNEIMQLMDLFPGDQFKKKNFKATVNKRITSLLALMAYTMSLASEKGERIDEVISHCYREVN